MVDAVDDELHCYLLEVWLPATFLLDIVDGGGVINADLDRSVLKVVGKGLDGKESCEQFQCVDVFGCGVVPVFEGL